MESLLGSRCKVRSMQKLTAHASHMDAFVKTVNSFTFQRTGLAYKASDMKAKSFFLKNRV